MIGDSTCNKAEGAPHPRFPVEVSGFPTLHAPFLKERRTRSPVQGCVQEIRGISLVFREMWDTTAFDLRPVEPNEHFSLRFVVSHISQKTSEMWGTLSFVAEPNFFKEEETT
jgi:hypothetical protein